MPSSEPATVTTFRPAEMEQLEASGDLGAGPADVISAAWAEAADVRAQARAAGHAEGRAAGLSEVREEAEPVLHALAKAIEEMETTKLRLLSELEQEAVDLALALAEKIVATALEVKPELVLDGARSALRRLADRKRITLQVNPADLEFLNESIDALRSELGGIEHCDVQADRRVSRGGVILSTDEGEIDATIEAQLLSAQEVIRDALRQRNADDRHV